jgi:hypothetical protein
MDKMDDFVTSLLMHVVVTEVPEVIAVSREMTVASLHSTRSSSRGT